MPSTKRATRASIRSNVHGPFNASTGQFWKNCGSEPDCGIWEVRGPAQHFTHSKIMCWVAFDRGIKDAEAVWFPMQARALEAHSRADPCDRVHARVTMRGRNAFVQSFGGKELDASLLLIPILGFLPPDDPRVHGTIAAVERELVRDGLRARYNSAATDRRTACRRRHVSRLQFLARRCACDVRATRRRGAALRVGCLTLSNDVGLLAEQYDGKTRRMLGNFPQAFSHLSLVGSAFNLSHTHRPSHQRAAQP